MVTLPRRPAPIRLIFNFSNSNRPSLQEREHQRRHRIYLPHRQSTPELPTPLPSQARTTSPPQSSTAQAPRSSRSRRSLAQQARRLRERTLRQQQLLSPESTAQSKAKVNLFATSVLIYVCLYFPMASSMWHFLASRQVEISVFCFILIMIVRPEMLFTQKYY